MHALEIIIKRNEEAAGREAAHAFNDGDDATFLAIIGERTTRDFRAAYVKAKEVVREEAPKA